MTITTNTTDRKALAKAIAEELGTTARYLGLPSYGYQIGDFTVDHDGNIIGEDFGALQDFLHVLFVPIVIDWKRKVYMSTLSR